MYALLSKLVGFVSCMHHLVLLLLSFIDAILKIFAFNDIAEVKQLDGVDVADIAYEDGEAVSAGL